MRRVPIPPDVLALVRDAQRVTGIVHDGMRERCIRSWLHFFETVPSAKPKRNRDHPTMKPIGLQVHMSSRVRQTNVLPTGETSIVFETQQTATEQAGVTIDVPRLFLIGIPVFYLGKRWVIPVRLRYRAGPDGLKWQLLLTRPKETVELAFDQMLATVSERTKAPVVRGGCSD